MQKFTLAIVLLQTAIIAVLLVLYLGQTQHPQAPSLESTPRTTTESSGEAEVRAAERRDELEVEPEVRNAVEANTAASSTGLEGTLLLGRITASDGQPVESPSLSVHPKGPSRVYISGSVHEGTYAVPSLQPGTYEISCRADGVTPLQAEIEIGTAATQVFDVELRRARQIKVKILDENGKPRLGIEYGIVASKEALPEAYPMTNLRTVSRQGTGRFQGRWQHRNLPEEYSGVLEVDTSEPIHVGVLLRQQVLARKLLAPDATEIEFIVATDALGAVYASARLRIVSIETGMPIEGARVSFSDRQSGGMGKPTDADGFVTIDRIVPGILELEVRAKDREYYHSNIRVEPGSKIDVGTIRLGAPRKIEGRVVDQQGKPVSGAKFTWIQRGRYAGIVPWDRGASAGSKSDGTFALWGCGPGQYFVRAMTDDLACETTIDTTSGDVSDVVLEMAPVSKVSYVSDVPNGKLYLVRLLRSGTVMNSWLLRPYTKPLDRKLDLVPGRYEVQVYEGKHLVRTIPLDARTSGAKFEIR
ncbi:MAG: carboxypeptidase regulatory-like domain-containing protein [Planctomycetes bacterium]|nr:carboxypeptidase regulatory-like domain-containing protein [Planctomycetota bacterium]